MARSQIEALLNIKTVVNLLGLNHQSGKVRTDTLGGLQIPLRFILCKTTSRLIVQLTGFDTQNKVKVSFGCKMFDVIIDVLLAS